MIEQIIAIPTGVYAAKTVFGLQWLHKEREEATRHARREINTIKTWCKSMLNRENKRVLNFEEIEYISLETNEFKVGLTVEYEDDVVDVVDAMLGRVHNALPLAGDCMRKIVDTCPENPASVKVIPSGIEKVKNLHEEDEEHIGSESHENPDAEYRVEIDNPDACHLIEELRKNSGRRTNKLMLTTMDSEVEVLIHQAGPTVEHEDSQQKIEGVVKDWSDERGTAIIGCNGQNHSLNWFIANEDGMMEDYVRNSLIEAMRDRVSVELLAHVISQTVCGKNEVRGYVLHEYLDRVQGELEL